METQQLKNLPGEPASEPAVGEWARGYYEGRQDAEKLAAEEINRLRGLIEAIRRIAMGE